MMEVHKTDGEDSFPWNGKATRKHEDKLKTRDLKVIKKYSFPNRFTVWRSFSIYPLKQWNPWKSINSYRSQ